MRVLLLNSRVDFLEKWGGDTTQIVKTGESLEKLGVAVDISSDVAPDVRGFDSAHIQHSDK